jgi:hypothetical protein
MPLRVHAGVARLFPHGWLSLDVDYQGPIANESLGIERCAVVNARVGGKVLLTDSVALGAGLFSDRSGDRAPRGYTDLKLDFYGATAGVELTNRYRLAPHQPHARLAFSSTFALRYAHGQGQIGGLGVPAPGPIDSIEFPRSNSLVDEFRLHLGSGVEHARICSRHARGRSASVPARAQRISITTENPTATPRPTLA